MGIFSFVKPGKKIFKTITSVKPNVGNPSRSALNKQIQKTKASGAKLKQTLFESKNKDFKGNDFTFATNTKKTPSNTELKKKKDDDAIAKEFGVRFKNATGGRVGLKRGTGLMQKKSNIQKIKETFGPKKRVNAKGGKLIGGQKKIDVAAPFGKITGEDFAKLRSKKNKKKVI